MPIPIDPPASPIFVAEVTVDDVKARLNKTLSVDDAEIQKMLNAALVEYAEWVGPLAGTVTETFDGGGSTLVLRSTAATAILAASYDSGITITVSDLSLDTRTGIVRWGYGTAGAFTSGQRVSVTYTVGSLAANHAETIAADVAGYFAATQRGGTTFAPTFAGEGYAEPFDSAPGSPVVLFPRIRALAASYPGVA